MWQFFKCVLFKSRHLFEVEVLKYRAIIDKRKFFGQEEIEPFILVGKRGLLQNRKRNSHTGPRSLTATDTEVDKYYKRIRDQNTFVKKQRDKFANKYFEKYPEKLEQLVKEEQEKRQKLEEELRKQAEEQNNGNCAVPKRSISLGIRNRSFKKENLTFSKDKRPTQRNLNYSDHLEIRPISKDRIGTKLQLNRVKGLTNKYTSFQHNLSVASNKENINKVTLKNKKNNLP